MPSAACCRREPTATANRKSAAMPAQLGDAVALLGRGRSGPRRVARREAPRARQQLADDLGVNAGWPRQIPSMRRPEFPLVRVAGLPACAKCERRELPLACERPGYWPRA